MHLKQTRERDANETSTHTSYKWLDFSDTKIMALVTTIATGDGKEDGKANVAVEEEVEIKVSVRFTVLHVLLRERATV